MKKIDQKGARPGIFIYDLQGQAGNVILEHQYHKPGPQPVPPDPPGPTPPGPICPCNVFSKCDKHYSGMPETQKNVWRKAVKKPGISGYTLWMKEALTGLMRDGKLPCAPSPSGGFACHELKLHDEPPPDWKCTIGAAPPPPPPPPPPGPEFDWFDDFNRPDGLLGPDWAIYHGSWAVHNHEAQTNTYEMAIAYWDDYLPSTVFDFKASIATYANRHSGFLVSNASTDYHYLAYAHGNAIWVGWLDGVDWHFLGGWSVPTPPYMWTVCLRFDETHFRWNLWYFNRWLAWKSWPWITPPTSDDLRFAGIWGQRMTGAWFPEIDNFHAKFPHFDI